ncbi:Ig-like domain-containing protein [Sphingomonas sp. HITSZ_GF]|uniref:Ig-like domain-containing protein n=1 Tax=Sphingomonas sp. HITSZ_GF TaxID=3037247 RepID=UPI00240D7CD2|nr:Ig-like domain-containing protein [Sphingomonas sp. HITSZ_GF]MDG2535105.1 Ig-like domain-containing protein [Sphingomonas sp. HITSZ_GF]
MPMLHVLSSIYLATAGIAQPAPAFLPNADPVAVNDTKSVQCGTIDWIDVLANDYDPDSDPLTITGIVWQTGNYGGAEVDGDTIAYSASAYGTDEIYYSVSDGHGGSAIAKLTVTVNSGTC